MPEVRSPTEISRAGFAAWNTGDIEAFLQIVHPDIDWVTSPVFPGLRPRYRGHAGIREFWATFMDLWETLEVEEERMVELDDQSALSLVRFHARGREGIAVDRRFANHMVMREGKLWRYKGYAEWEQALTELGIEDPREGATAP